MIVKDITGRDKYVGVYRATVVDVSDSINMQGAIRVTIPEIFGDMTSLPALPKFPNSMAVPQLGSLTWIEFEKGDPTLPIYNGVFFSAAGTDKSAPLSSIERPSHVVRGYSRSMSFDTNDHTVVEPHSGFNTVYPNSSVSQKKSGTMIEVDDTPGNERYQVAHPSGTYFEFKRDGSAVYKTAGKKQEFVTGSEYKYTTGNRFDFVGGNLDKEIKGNSNEFIGAKKNTNIIDSYDMKIGGAYNVEIEGSQSHNVKGTITSKIQGSVIESIIGAKKSMVGDNEETVILGSQNIIASNVTLSPNVYSFTGVNGDYTRKLAAGRFVDVSSLGYGIDTLMTFDVNAIAGINFNTASYSLTSVHTKINTGTYSLEALQNISMLSASNDIAIGSLAGAVASLGKEKMVRGDTLVKVLSIIIQMIQNHLHPTPVGPSGPLLPPDLLSAINLDLSLSSILSDTTSLVELAPTSTTGAALIYPLTAPITF